MKDSHTAFLSALRSFVQGTPPRELTEAQLREVLELARIHSVYGILCYVYMKNPEGIPPAILPALRQQCYTELAVYAERAQQMKVLAEALDNEGIDCLLFKGFVVREYYPVPELRTFGDIDFVIRQEDREKSDALMKKLGYQPKENWEPVYAYVKGSEFYEVHTNVMEVDVSDAADYVEYYSHIWEHTQPSMVVEKSHALEFKPEFHFLYLLTHIAKHISASGAGIRMYLDIAFFIRHFGETLDWKWVLEELKKLHMDAFANMVFTVVERWFGVAGPVECKAISQQTLDDFLAFTLEGGVYGFVGRDKGTVFLKQHNRNEEDVSKAKTLLYHAFPPKKVLENRFTYLQKHGWLLPAAWVHRLAVSRKEWRRFADHTKDILQADSEEVLKLKRIYKEIGL